MYDWANSAFMTTIVAAVFPIYFNRVAAADLDPTAASLRFAMATTIGLSIVAVLAPILGAVADCAGIKKKMLGAFMGLGILATACMFFIQQGDWLLAAVLFVLGNIGASGSFVFYDSLLPHIARADEIDRVSTAGYALGYLGGGTLLAVNLAWILRPDLFRPRGNRHRHPTLVLQRGHLVAGVFDSAVSQGAGAAARPGIGRATWRTCHHRGVRTPG